MVLLSGFADAQSQTGASGVHSSGIDAMNLSAYSLPASATGHASGAGSFADAASFCDDDRCAASLTEDQQWTALGDFGTAAALRFGAGARLGSSGSLGARGWSASPGESALVWQPRRVTLTAVASAQPVALSVTLPPQGSSNATADAANLADLAVAASVEAGAKCGLRVTPSGGGPASVVGVLFPTPTAGGGSAPSITTLSAVAGGSALALVAYEGACTLAYVLHRSTSRAGAGFVGGTPLQLSPAATHATLPLSPSPVAGSALQLLLTGTNNAGLRTPAVSARIVLDDTPPSTLAVLHLCTPEGLAGTSTSASTSAGGTAVFYQPSTSMRVCWDVDGTYADAQSGVWRLEWRLMKRVASGTTLWRSGDVEANTTVSLAASGAQSVGLTLGASVLGLVSGVRYEVRLRARNRAGLASQWTSSGVLGIDLSPPVTAAGKLAICPISGCGASAVGSGSDALPSYQFNTSSVRVRWAGLTDAQSGIASCAAAVVPHGSPAPLSEPSRWQPIADCAGSGAALLTGFAFGHATSWTVWLWPTNGAGLASAEAIASAELFIDTVAPSTASVTVLDAADMMEAALDLDHRPHLTAQPLQVCCQWTGFADAETSLAVPAYEWSLSSSSAATTPADELTADVVEWTATEDTKACAALPLGTLHPTVLYRCAARATNVAGLTSAPVASDGFTYDATPPAGGWVLDGLQRGLDAQLLHNVALGCQWGGFNDTEYGDDRLTYSVGAGPCAQWEQLILTDVQTNTSAAFATVLGPSGHCVPMPVRGLASDATPCTFPTNTTICFVVEATNHHGHTTRRRSDGVVTCSESGISVGTVRDRVWASPLLLNSGDADYASSRSLPFTWRDFHTTCAPIETYTVQLQTKRAATLAEVASGADEAIEWEPTPLPNVSVGAFSPPPPGPVGARYPWLASFDAPTDGHYRALVCATNVLGDVACASSDGTLVDTSPPEGTLTVCARAPHGEIGCGNRSALVADVRAGAFLRWGGCTDPQSGIGRFAVTLWQDEPPSTSTYEVGLTTEFKMPSEVVASNVPTTVSVQCFNRAGLAIGGGLGPVSFDDTPPTIGAGALAIDAASGRILPGLGPQGGGRQYVSSSSITLTVDPSKLVDFESGVRKAQLLVRAAGGEGGGTSGRAHLDTDVVANGRPVGPSADGLVRSSVDLSSVPEKLLDVSLVATNAAGLQTVHALPSPLVYDPTPPTLDGQPSLSVCDAAGAPLAAQHATGQLRLCLVSASSSSFVARSGISLLRVALSTAPSAGVAWAGVTRDVVPPPSPSTGGRSALSLDGLTLPCDATVMVDVRGVSGAGLVANEANTLRASVDVVCSPPANGAVSFDGSSVAPQPAPSALQCAKAADVEWMHARWAGFGGGVARATAFSVGVGGNARTLLADPAARSLPLANKTVAHAEASGLLLKSAVSVEGCNRVGLCTEASAELLVVADAPSGGLVTWQPQPATRPGYMTSWEDLGASWQGFTDASASLSALKYEVCVGTSPVGCQLLRFSKGGVAGTSWSVATRLGSLAAPLIALQCGATYHVAVRATNCAGLERVVASDGVKHCCYPPSGGRVTLVDAAGDAASFVSSVDGLRIVWSGFDEPCAGVSHYAAALVSTLGDTVWTQNVSAANFSGEVALPEELAAQLSPPLSLSATVIAVSMAGAHADTSSNTVVLDRTPPVTGSLAVHWPGHESAAALAHLSPSSACVRPSAVSAAVAPTTPVRVSWGGAYDDESGIASFSFGRRLVAPNGTGVPGIGMATTWTDVGLVRSLELPLDLTMPATYAVKACNRVGQCSTSDWTRMAELTHAPSGGSAWVLPTSSNVPGFITGVDPIVHVGWSGFKSGSNASGLQFEACIGTSPLGCQLQRFTPTGVDPFAPESDLVWSGSPKLQCGATYHVAVRATNCAGLERVVASDGVKHCCHPPSGGRVTLVDAAGKEASVVSSVDGLRIVWSGFDDYCSGIRQYRVRLLDGSGAPIWTSTVDEGNRTGTGGIELPATVDADMVTGGRYSVQMIATSLAGMDGGVANSPPLTLDRTPPDMGAVTIEWPGHASARRFASLAPGGRICMPAAVPSATLAWAGASDPQSGIVSFDVGVRPVVTMGPAMTLPASWEPMGSAYVRSKELSAASIPLGGGLDVQFAVRGCNGVGLCNESAFSSGARRVEPPGGGSVYLHHSPHASPGFVGGEQPTILTNWSGFTAGTEPDPSNLKYEVCVGTSPLGCQLVPFTSDGVGSYRKYMDDYSYDADDYVGAEDAWFVSARSPWLLGSPPPLRCGATYHVAVRATNCAGLERVVASDGVKHCCHPPSGGRVTLVDAAGDAASFVSSVDGLRIVWSGFDEPCAGVRHYFVGIRDVVTNATVFQADTVQPEARLVNEVLLAGHLADANLSHGRRYQAAVAAVSHAGLVGGLVTSADFIVDSTTPSVGTLLDGADSPVDLTCLPTPAAPGCTWTGVHDDESGIRTLEWALGTAPNATDVQNYTEVPWQAKTAALLGPVTTLSVGSSLYCSLRVTNGAGGVITHTSNGAKLVEATCASELPTTCSTPIGDGALAPLD